MVLCSRWTRFAIKRRNQAFGGGIAYGLATLFTLVMANPLNPPMPQRLVGITLGGPMTGGYRTSAAPQPRASCFDCHATHAARDNVFTQSYGLLNEAAPRK